VIVGGEEVERVAVEELAGSEETVTSDVPAEVDECDGTDGIGSVEDDGDTPTDCCGVGCDEELVRVPPLDDNSTVLE
jgi:hypothetical protein